ncbi:bifunctional nicotinamidase/pyrazinamidase [Olleya sp. HaHaR_3_96]|uniref:bifunctional nicotinamidase/pyrazinamidase n=1 Tax=Olleya sp. HaHaR_3_96 TaxID=2745560 RepID=UPI001C4E59A7|nr:bifunctional nicotinamidase/pyrazinamidase [Olleya sp. HaHaR_3_96]QXP59245.1 bifunctional nicotinamidase/pyrazinamidase [Olleya sp. HaHaR_3_96]
MKTLLVIDVQNDFMPGGSLAVPDGDNIVPVINSIQDKFDLIVATQDWHPKTHSSFAVNHDNKSNFDSIEWRGKTQILWPEHCVEGSKGAELHSELDTIKYEAIFRKGTDKNIDSYSAFYDNNHLKSTGLAGYLKEKEASKLYFCGLASDICVYFSIRDAVQEGFECYFIEDAAKALDLEVFEAIKIKMITMGVHIITSESI